VADNDYVVQFGTRGGRWPGGEFRGIYVPAGPYEREVAFIYRLQDSCIAERWSVRDDLGMMQQLGALSRPRLPFTQTTLSRWSITRPCGQPVPRRGE
jgi:hypothetical protein